MKNLSLEARFGLLYLREKFGAGNFTNEEEDWEEDIIGVHTLSYLC